MANDRNVLVSLEGRHCGLNAAGDLLVDGKIVAPFYKSSLCELYDDFLGDTLVEEWGNATGSDGAVVAPAINAQAGGVVRAVTGAGATLTMAVNGVQLHSALNWYANKDGLTFETSIKASAVTSLCLYAGFTDQVAALEMPFTLSSGSLTSNATDAVGFLFDTAATASTIKLVGVANDVDATFYDTGLAFVAATYRKLRIEVDTSGNAKFFIDGSLIAAVALCVTPTIGLTPVVAAFSRVATLRNIDIDYVICRQDR